MADLPAEFWVLRSTPHPSYFIVQSVLPPVQKNAVVVAGPFGTQAEAQTWIDNHSGPNPPPSGHGLSWYVLWSHTGTSATSGWTGKLDGPFPFNEAPVAGVITINGVTYPQLTGPYNSAAQAQAYIKSHPHGPPSESSTNINIPTIPNPFAFLGWLQGIQHWFGIIVAAITDVHTWISLGWGLLGLIFLISGVWLWLKQSGIMPDISSAPIPVPV